MSGVHGVFVADKPSGPTSHDVVARVRRWVHPLRVGHTGTLDPMVTGVLVVCIGSATRLTRFLAGGTKEYTGTIVFGASTDTYDAEGKVVDVRSAEGITLDTVRAAAASFVGEILQVPPPWSAKKVGGRRAYDLARAGQPQPLPACKVSVERFDIDRVEGGRGAFRVVCSAGTYIRSLANDMGEALGCGAHLAALRRGRAGPFTLNEAHSPATFEEAARSGRLPELILPLESLDLGMPALTLTLQGALHAAAGRPVPWDCVAEGPPPPDARLVRLLSPSGRLMAVAETGDGSAEGVQPRIVLPPDDAGLQTGEPALGPSAARRSRPLQRGRGKI